MDRCIEEWEPGSRTRQIRSQSLKQFLDHCVAREKFPSAWLITSQLKDHVGKKPANRTKQSGDAIEDQQIINLINSFPETCNANKWADAIRLISELGLRPIELNHLSVRKDKKTGSLYWWCSYQKRGGGGTTEPRKLHPLLLVNDQSEIQQWKLMQRWQANMIPLPNAVDSQHRIRDFLRKIGSVISYFFLERSRYLFIIVLLTPNLFSTSDKNFFLLSNAVSVLPSFQKYSQ